MITFLQYINKLNPEQVKLIQKYHFCSCNFEKYYTYTKTPINTTSVGAGKNRIQFTNYQTHKNEYIDHTIRGCNGIMLNQIESIVNNKALKSFIIFELEKRIYTYNNTYLIIFLFILAVPLLIVGVGFCIKDLHKEIRYFCLWCACILLLSILCIIISNVLDKPNIKYMNMIKFLTDNIVLDDDDKIEICEFILRRV